MTTVRSVVKLLQQEHDRLTRQINGIAATLEAFGATYAKQNGSRKISNARMTDTAENVAILPIAQVTIVNP
jgi:hypothetical protein